jgi:hypothetical protein
VISSIDGALFKGKSDAGADADGRKAMRSLAEASEVGFRLARVTVDPSFCELSFVRRTDVNYCTENLINILNVVSNVQLSGPTDGFVARARHTEPTIRTGSQAMYK